MLLIQTILKYIAPIVLTLLVGAWLFWFWDWSDFSEPKEPVFDQTATELPPDVRDNWFAAVNQGLDRVIVYEGRIRLPPLPGFDGDVVYLPIDQTQVSCGEYGISIGTRRGLIDKEEKLIQWMMHPELGVGWQSPAAIALMDDLCRYVIDQLPLLESKTLLNSSVGNPDPTASST